ncbi:spinster family MFS transporter [Steroidobacter sp.]|uniref:spinster family MFS transporter n=1 Tax=Steroidobacter sp. TaxID=1978227 RepID=UPI001A5F445A|nr:MFS transporter [Steroidobacter sp.]MBL8267312.1 MFS transporter [Steroidobacter sp.]
MAVEARSVGDRAVSANGTDASTGFSASNAYRNYVVWLLFVIYVFNYVDRQILSIVLEPIKQEFGLHDWQLGLLSGLAFAAFYSTLGIPIARLADTRNRVNIITASIVVWSAFTVVSGMAKNFWHLLFARIGVGIGEAGCSPSAYSIISDYVEPKKRATALSIYSMGVYGGSALGFLVGGLVAHEYGWRAAFYTVGLPGLIVAIILKLTVKEPPRGFSDPGTVVSTEPPPFREVMGNLWAKRSFRHLSIAAGLHAFVSYGLSSFYSPFFMRTHGMTLGDVGAWLALVVALGGLTGTYLGGLWCDRYYARTQDPRWYVWIPAITLLMVVPFGQVVYALDNTVAAMMLLVLYIALAAAYLGPSIATTHRLVGLRERALASAFLLLILNFIGLGLGPMFTGAMSDLFKEYFVSQGVAEKLALADGLRWSIRLTLLINLWSALHYFLAAKTLRQDIEVGNQARAAAA